MKTFVLLASLMLYGCGDNTTATVCNSEFNGYYYNDDPLVDPEESLTLSNTCQFDFRWADVCVAQGSFQSPVSQQGTIAVTLDFDNCLGRESMNCSYEFVNNTINFQCDAIARTFTKAE